MKPFYKSRKFVLLAMDAAAALITLWVKQFVPPATAVFILQTLAILQPVILAVIIGIAVEDQAALKAGTHPSQLTGDSVGRHSLTVGSVQNLEVN